MPWYRTGTISVTNGSTTVTGSGTSWVTNALAGEGLQAPDGRVYEIASITSATQLTLASAYLGSNQTGQTYAILPTHTFAKDLASEVSALVVDYQTSKSDFDAGSFSKGTTAAPGINFGVNGQSNTGFTNETTGEIGISIAGTNRGKITATGLNGTTIGATTPAPITGTSIVGTSLNVGTGALTAGRGVFTIATPGDVVTLTKTGGLSFYGYADGVYAGWTTGSTITGTGFYVRDDANKQVVALVNSSGIATFSSTGLSVTGGGTFSGALQTTNNTDASNVGTGALQSAGGLSVAHSIWVGGNQFNVAASDNYEMVHRGAGGWKFYTDSGSKQPFTIDRLAPTGTCAITSSGLSVTGGGTFSGNVGIGTSSPLSAYSGAARVAMVAATGTNAASLRVSSANASGELYSAGYVTEWGLYSASNSPFKIWTNNNAAATIDASGNLGLGVTTAQTFVSSTETTLTIKGNAANKAAALSVVNASGDCYGGIGVGEAVDSMYLGTSTNHPVIFLTNTTERARIDSSGNLLVGTTTSGTTVNADSSQLSNGTAVITHVNGTSSGAAYGYFSYNGTVIGSITQNGTTAVAYNTTSDHRLKENVRPADALRFMDIEFVDFEWVDGRHDCGVIAHQLASVYPDLVLGEKDATEIRQIEVSPAVPAVTEQQIVTEAVLDDDGNEIEPAVYETVEVSPAVDAVYEDQEFPVYQQVNYTGLIGRIGTRLQSVIRENETLKAQLSAIESRLAALEAA